MSDNYTVWLKVDWDVEKESNIYTDYYYYYYKLYCYFRHLVGENDMKAEQKLGNYGCVEVGLCTP